MKKKILSLGLVLVLTLSMLSACGGTGSETQNSEVASQSTEDSEAVSEAIDEVLTETTETITEETTETTVEEDETPSESEQPSEPEQPDEPTEPSEPKEDEVVYTFTELSATMYAKSAVNVRDLPSSNGDKLGGLSAGQEVKVTGQCNETSWYRIEYNGGVGYVSNSYLVNEKPAEPEPPKPDEPVQPDNPEPDEPELPFVLYQVIDTGDKIYYWSEPNNHSPEATAARSAANELATRMAGERWGTNCHGIWDYDQYAGHYFMVCWMKIN